MSDVTSTGSDVGRRRWLVLGVIALAQLMVVLDLTVMNIALPSAQRALHFTTVDRQWVVTAYTQLGASVGTSLLNTIFTAAVTSYTAAHLASARLIGRQALTGLALVHGYDTAFWWTAGIFAGGAIIGGLLLRRGPLVPAGASPQAHGEVPTTKAKAGPRPSA